MSNSALVSFKLPPEHYAVLKAMAKGQRVSLSQFVRETVILALDLERHGDRLAAMFAEDLEEAEA